MTNCRSAIRNLLASPFLCRRSAFGHLGVKVIVDGLGCRLLGVSASRTLSVIGRSRVSKHIASSETGSLRRRCAVFSLYSSRRRRRRRRSDRVLSLFHSRIRSSSFPSPDLSYHLITSSSIGDSKLLLFQFARIVGSKNNLLNVWKINGIVFFSAKQDLSWER